MIFIYRCMYIYIYIYIYICIYIYIYIYIYIHIYVYIYVILLVGAVDVAVVGVARGGVHMHLRGGEGEKCLSRESSNSSAR